MAIFVVMKNFITIASLSDIDRAAQEFLSRLGDRTLVAFYGQMGAGKTTFTVALCKALGVVDPVCSPTFTIINEYRSTSGRTIYHFDFYRIKNNAEAMDIGVDDYFYSGNLCLMEWPENVADLLPDQTLAVKIFVNEDLSRTISWDD